MQSVDFIATIAGVAIAIAIQRRGWWLRAKQLVLKTLDNIEERSRNPD